MLRKKIPKAGLWALVAGAGFLTQLLRPRISQFSVSLIVPMGAEYYYRQQERMVDDALRALRQVTHAFI